MKVSQLGSVVQLLTKKQGGKCAVCGFPFTQRDRPVLDHDHDTGRVRGVLHNSCNGAEGRIKSKAKMGHTGVSAADYVIGLGKYLELHKKPQTRLIHHTHLTEDEKRLKRNVKARKRRRAKKA